MGAWATFFEAADVGAAETDRPVNEASVVIEQRPRCVHAGKSQTGLKRVRQS